MDRYVCIHCHFYQPPRENPWLEAVELQDSAFPYHDWNERISAECYAANAFSRSLAGDGRIEKIVNNYSRISFNFGPTLLSWMEEKSPAVYRAILEGDRESRKTFSGHGSALAQGYNHIILPLANARDKATQVRWGIRDFTHRFGRPPEGMWLPETAADVGTLDVLAGEGIRFTILAPRQAAKVRKKGSRDWRDVSNGRIDPTIPYELRLPSGRKICLFFYDGPISQGVAFERLLDNGEFLANRLLGAFSDQRPWPQQLVHIATDGETYGHHHTHGEMALSKALQLLDANPEVRITNYGEHLERFPPTHDVRIFDNSSWSCVHGVERWRSDCGCNSGGRPGWNQEWRRPLREAMDGLRDTIAPLFEGEGRKVFKDPWAAREEYISVILDRSDASIDEFLARHAAGKLTPKQKTRALQLMEIQRQAMLMYTSCGWFFDDLSGIETVQVLQYAGRVIQLSGDIFGDSVEAGFLTRLERAKSNVPEHKDGRALYDKFVKPATVDLHKVAAHYAVSALFENYGERDRIYCYDVERHDIRVRTAGRTKLLLGRARVTSEITRKTAFVTFGVLHLGDHNISGGVRDFRGEEEYETLTREIGDVFKSADLPEAIRTVDKQFGLGTYSLKLLFRDELRKILHIILDQTLSGTEASHREIYNQHASMMRFLSGMDIPLPDPLHASAKVTLNAGLRRAVSAETLDATAIRGLLEEGSTIGIQLVSAGLGFPLQKRIDAIANDFREKPDDLGLLHRFEEAVEMGHDLPFEVLFWGAQNIYFELLQTVYPGFLTKSREGDEQAALWIGLFRSIGKKLSFVVPED
ncbi:MAG: glycoside hydrolase [Deltaproteobacteria bacterium CG_4_9_14_3_um_filter_65_9]|nr:MAG: glycoside hydrolase [Deltaproteobacteria bacterium CG_4_9_14_3_um_filter_65_9]